VKTDGAKKCVERVIFGIEVKLRQWPVVKQRQLMERFFCLLSNCRETRVKFVQLIPWNFGMLPLFVSLKALPLYVIAECFACGRAPVICPSNWSIRRTIVELPIDSGEYKIVIRAGSRSGDRKTTKNY